MRSGDLFRLRFARPYIDETGKEFLAPSLAWACDFKDGVAYVLEYANMKTADDKKPVAYVTKESIQNFTSGKTRFPTLGLGGGIMSTRAQVATMLMRFSRLGTASTALIRQDNGARIAVY